MPELLIKSCDFTASPYVNGDINGQDGWTADAANAFVIGSGKLTGSAVGASAARPQTESHLQQHVHAILLPTGATNEAFDILLCCQSNGDKVMLNIAQNFNGAGASRLQFYTIIGGTFATFGAAQTLSSTIGSPTTVDVTASAPDGSGVRTYTGIIAGQTNATITPVTNNAVSLRTAGTVGLRMDSIAASYSNLSYYSADAPPYTITGVTVSPATASLAGLGTQQFSAVVTGTGTVPQGVTWTKTAGVGSINSSGLYTAPAATSSPQTATIQALASDGTTVGTATITIASTGVNVSLDQANQIVNQLASVAVNASVTGGSPTTVTWSGSALAYCTGSANQRTFAAPAIPGTYTLTATSVADTSRSASVVFTVPAAALNFATTAQCQLGSTVAISAATLAGTSIASGTITYALPDGGTYASGVFSPPAGAVNGGTYRIVASGAGLTATCTVTMTNLVTRRVLVRLNTSGLTSLDYQRFDTSSGAAVDSVGQAVSVVEQAVGGNATSALYVVPLPGNVGSQYNTTFWNPADATEFTYDSVNFPQTATSSGGLTTQQDANLTAIKAKTDALITLVSGVVSGTPTALTFTATGNLAAQDNAYKNGYLLFVSGAAAGVVPVPVLSYAGASKTFLFGAPGLTVTPAVGDVFVIVGSKN